MSTRVSAPFSIEDSAPSGDDSVIAAPLGGDVASRLHGVARRSS
jgi:hypothetical protein